MEAKKSINISEQFSFNFKNDITIGQTQEVLAKYYHDFDNAFSLNGRHVIFLDTNILLNYYGMSSADKMKLKTFFIEKNDRIKITQQIEKEFQRNRISAIEDYFDELNKIKLNYKQDLQDGIKNRFNNILQSKIVEKDFPEIRVSIEKIYSELEKKLFDNEELTNSINSKIDVILKENKNLEYLDPILEIYSSFERIPDLEDNEIIYLESSYSENLEVYKGQKDSHKDRYSFPGCGEKKDKDLCGDYIIFHEILKFMFLNKRDVIFLTRDVTKSDWLQKSRKPFIHYIEKAYQLTGQLLYIFDATDLLSMISFENIYQIDDNQNIQNEDDSRFYRDQFNHLVSSIEDTLYYELSEDSTINKVLDRNINGHDIDLIIETPFNVKEGLIVYNCGSTRKGYKRNIQKRINACNKLINERICNSSTLVVSLSRKSWEMNFDYGEISSQHPVKILIGNMNNSAGEFIITKRVFVN